MRDITKSLAGRGGERSRQPPVRTGEIHALVGENGAGKIDADEHPLRPATSPTSGEILVDGSRSGIAQPARRHRRRHRHGAPALHADPSHDGRREHHAGPRAGTPRRLLRHARARAGDRASSARSTASTSTPTRASGDLPVGLQQRVEILKALYRGADILILDEPTAVLTPQETDELFARPARPACKQGKTIIFITHKLREVLAISDRITVMRRGKVVGDLHDGGRPTSRRSPRMMVGPRRAAARRQGARPSRARSRCASRT